MLHLPSRPLIDDHHFYTCRHSAHRACQTLVIELGLRPVCHNHLPQYTRPQCRVEVSLISCEPRNPKVKVKVNKVDVSKIAVFHRQSQSSGKWLASPLSHLTCITWSRVKVIAQANMSFIRISSKSVWCRDSKPSHVVHRGFLNPALLPKPLVYPKPEPEKNRKPKKTRQEEKTVQPQECRVCPVSMYVVLP